MLSAVWVAAWAVSLPWTGSDLEQVHTETFFVEHPNSLFDFDKTEEQKRLDSARMEKDNLARYDQAYGRGRRSASCFGTLKQPVSTGLFGTQNDGLEDNSGIIVWQCDSYYVFIFSLIQNLLIICSAPIVLPILIFLFLLTIRWIKAGFRD